MIEVAVAPDRVAAGEPVELTVRLTNADSGPCTHVVLKLELPRQVALLSGTSRIEVARLGAGESVERVLRVRPDEEGRWVVRSGNFSYRDRWGDSRRVVDFRTGIEVTPRQAARVVPEPEFTVTLVDRVLPDGRWSLLRGRVANTGVPVLVGLAVGISGPFDVDAGGARQLLGSLAPGDTAEFTAHVRPTGSGTHVPVRIDVDCRTDAGLTRSARHTVDLHVRSADERPGRAPTDRTRILYLSANPSDTHRLRLAAESRAIQEQLRFGVDRDHYAFHERSAVRTRDITQALLDVRPRIVHFSGHAEPDGRLYVENEVGASRLVSVDGLASLFEQVSDTVECVIVNACDTVALAEAVARHVDHVIGMRQPIGDDAAIAFSVGFYQALAAGEPVPKAFGMACVQIRLDDGTHAEHGTPLLLGTSV
ncbi:CHAT domain-containing protein [Actinosynnema sp. NPDC050436]|uniref:CHAT domain-containing protein n=1 Tax=Actinosynnema sp. NPDC050436 TaxID=3155659 RepID=UPI0033E8B5D5